MNQTETIRVERDGISAVVRFTPYTFFMYRVTVDVEGGENTEVLAHRDTVVSKGLGAYAVELVGRLTSKQGA